ncbi:unnamed protein product [Pieris brassicae]|uniref:Reverse transcriptase domain-containing protein n=1 Tax=Pieris brassicae TaxID=7116 RepID=A0A9P0XGV6_PIEBR|nr:unnamed protein product [Pieris brassicae]
MESFVLSWGLLVHNVQGQPDTFSSPNGSSNIDATLGTRGVRIDGWTVHADLSASDHRLITFVIHLGSASSSGQLHQARSSEQGMEPIRFRDRGVDWDRFRSDLTLRVGRITFNAPAQAICSAFTSAVVTSAEKCLGVVKPKRHGGYEWWSGELDGLRRQHNKFRREWQQARRAGGLCEEIARKRFHLARTRYRKAMRNAETEHYRRISDSGNEDPWGMAYRLASGRVRPPSGVVNGMKLSQGFATNMEEAMSGVLAIMYPDDDVAVDSPYHSRVRLAAAFAPSGKDVDIVDRSALDRIVKSLPNKCPGLDGITARIAKVVWNVAASEMMYIYSKCVREGVFPDVWKIGRLVVIPKGNGRPLTDPKAYRPVTLLSVLGKILERLICECTPGLYGRISPNQHGFMHGKSTVTALSRVLDVVRETNHKYVQAILLDISGAFDNAWWPMVLVKFKQGGCPRNVYRLLCSYFTGRRVGMFANNVSVWKNSTMGCPQGSVLGPTLWNILVDDLLRMAVPPGVELVAYADDVTVLIEANSRADIEWKAATTLQLALEWGQRNRLSFSSSKTQSITLKGRFQRPPVIRLGGDSVKAVGVAKLLGVVLDERGTFAEHAQDIGDRGARCFGKMARVSASNWGIRYPALRLLYYGTFVATITYAAAVWYGRSLAFVVASRLLRAQRSALVLLTKAYRTTSTPALAVLGGVLPADLEVYRAGKIQATKRETAKGEVNDLKRRVHSEVVDKWQERWEVEERGRDLQRFFPCVRGRLRAAWVAPDYFTSQLLAGHGAFNGRLRDLGLKEVGTCPCGLAEEYRDHVLWECGLYDREREEMLDRVVTGGPGPVYFADLVASEANYAAFSRFARAWHRARSEIDAEEKGLRRALHEQYTTGRDADVERSTPTTSRSLVLSAAPRGGNAPRAALSRERENAHGTEIA